MNRKAMSKRVLALVVISTFLSTNLVYGMEIKQDESVFVTMDSKGNVKERVVSSWLHSDEKGATIKGKTNLNNIKNLKSDETPDVSGEDVTWNLKDNDVYYQGNSYRSLPLSVNIKYFLDGEEISPEDIGGKSGRVKIEFNLKNNERKNIEINGSEREVYVPFTAVSIINLSDKNFKNIKASTGEVLDDGNKSVITFVSMPGLKDSLKLNDFDDIKLNEDLIIEADAENFELGSIMITATPKLPEMDKLEKADSIDEIKDALTKLQDASNKLIDGSKTLSDKQGEFASYIEKLLNGTNTLNFGANALNMGIDKLSNGTNALKDGSEKLYKGINSKKSSLELLENSLKEKELQDKLSLVLDNKKVQRERDLLKDAFKAKDINTSCFDKLTPLANEDNLNLALKTIKDYKNLNLNEFKKSPIFNEASSVLVEENIKNLESLINDYDSINNLSSEKLNNALALLDKMPKFFNTLKNGQAELESLDINEINNFIGMLDKTKDMKIGLSSLPKYKDILVNAKNKLDNNIKQFEVIKDSLNKLNSLENKKVPTEKGNTELYKLLINAVNNTYPKDKPNTAKLNIALTQLVNAQYGFVSNANQKAPEIEKELKQNQIALNNINKLLENSNLQNTINTLNSALSEENINNIKAKLLKIKTLKEELNSKENRETLALINNSLNENTLNELKNNIKNAQNCFKDLKNNKQNVQVIKNSMSFLYSKEGREFLNNSKVMVNDIDNMSPLINNMSSYLDENKLPSLNSLKGSVKELKEMQGRLKNSEDILNIISSSLIPSEVEKIRGFYSKTPELINGFNMLDEGSYKLYEGLSKLQNGSSMLKMGGTKLSLGTEKLENSTNKLCDASHKLKEGSEKLNDGLNKFKEEGIDKIYTKGNDGIDKINDILELKDKILDLSKEYDNFSGKGENFNSSVKFIMKTNEIKAPKVEETKALQDNSKNKTGIFEKIKSFINNFLGH